ncbi:MAG: MBOAT family protein [Chloroflexi bacterium]|nr:MBOAT family protein [Chloroflexota bacterium]
MIGLVIFAYGAAWLIEKWRGNQSSLYVLWTGIFLTVALLIGFKLRTEATYPLGLSYVTFQVIEYFVDVYKNPENYEIDILKFSFYLLLFPKIPVGPIVPYRQVKAQIVDLKSSPVDVADGLRRFLKGFAKKVLIADTLATVVVPVFNLQSPVIAPGYAWLVIISYSLQLYYDFSGYTDMAIGLGNMMGVRLMENFNLPYLSRSIGDFWRRWHISLSTWFREIVFYPLERRRLRWLGQQINILAVFALTG